MYNKRTVSSLGRVCTEYTQHFSLKNKLAMWGLVYDYIQLKYVLVGDGYKLLLPIKVGFSNL